MAKCSGSKSFVSTSSSDFFGVACWLNETIMTLVRFYETWEAQLVEALLYKPKGRGFDPRRFHWNLSLTLTSGRTMALGLTQP
jgi:hypothetical protein